MAEAHIQDKSNYHSGQTIQGINSESEIGGFPMEKVEPEISVVEDKASTELPDGKTSTPMPTFLEKTAENIKQQESINMLSPRPPSTIEGPDNPTLIVSARKPTRKESN